MPNFIWTVEGLPGVMLDTDIMVAVSVLAFAVGVLSIAVSALSLAMMTATPKPRPVKLKPVIGIAKSYWVRSDSDVVVDLSTFRPKDNK